MHSYSKIRWHISKHFKARLSYLRKLASCLTVSLKVLRLTILSEKVSEVEAVSWFDLDVKSIIIESKIPLN